MREGSMFDFEQALAKIEALLAAELTAEAKGAAVFSRRLPNPVAATLSL